MNPTFSCCGISSCSHTSLSSEENLDARVPQDEIGLVYDKLSGVYDIWGRLTESRARGRAFVVHHRGSRSHTAPACPQAGRC